MKNCFYVIGGMKESARCKGRGVVKDHHDSGCIYLLSSASYLTSAGTTKGALMRYFFMHAKIGFWYMS